MPAIRSAIRKHKPGAPRSRGAGLAARLGAARLLPMHSPDSNRGITLAIAASLLFHSILLLVQFRLPDANLFRRSDSQLEVVLVNSKSARKPVDPLVRAQANLDGGGNTDENRRARSPLPPAPQTRPGTDLVQMQRRPQAVDATHQALLTRPASDARVHTDKLRQEQPEDAPRVSGHDLAQTALAMARMEAEIARRQEEYAKRPRKRFVGARASEAVEALYVEDWRQKVERVGNLNYPEAARGRLYGSLVVSVSIRADGQVDVVEVNRSSGHKVLDDAARRIIQLAGPFGVFPAELRRIADILVITRTWTFTAGDRLLSE